MLESSLADTQEQLDSLNINLKSILSSQEEKILFRPILGRKSKPKNILGIFQANWRYLMFTNRKLYTLNPKSFESNIIK